MYTLKKMTDTKIVKYSMLISMFTVNILFLIFGYLLVKEAIGNEAFKLNITVMDTVASRQEWDVSLVSYLAMNLHLIAIIGPFLFILITQKFVWAELIEKQTKVFINDYRYLHKDGFIYVTGILFPSFVINIIVTIMNGANVFEFSIRILTIIGILLCYFESGILEYNIKRLINKYTSWIVMKCLSVGIIVLFITPFMLVDDLFEAALLICLFELMFIVITYTLNNTLLSAKKYGGACK